MYKYIFSDLDGTLFDDDKNVSENNLKAINKAQEKGVNFILCSGRAPFFMESPLRKVGHFNDPSKYVLSLNGGCIVNGCNELLDGRPFDKKIAKEIITLANDEGNLAFAVAFKDKYMRVDPGVIPEDMRHKWKWDELCKYDATMDELDRDKAYKLMVMSLDHELLEKFKDKILSIYDNVEVTFSSNVYLEVNPKGVSKETGIKRFLKIVNGTIDECIAIGDYLNDLDMIKACGLGCCPSNANEEVKKVANYVCKNDNNHDAIAEIINKFILEEK